jgi:hypothetical protein
MLKPLQSVLLLLFACAFVCLLVSCRDVPKSPVTNTPCTAPQKITAIYKEFVYDLSGYQSSGGSSPFNLFDENSYFDPRTGLTGFPETGPHPTRGADNYFPFHKGSRIVVDLRIPYKLSEIYLYDRSSQSDTVWIYTGDMNNWKLKATILTRDDVNARGWRKFAVEDSTQFIQFRFNSPQANISEAVLYGCPLQAVPPAPVTGYTGTRLARKPMKEFLGVNMYNEIPLEWLEPFKWVRMYTIADLFDADTVNAYPNNKISITRLGYLYQGQYFRHYADDMGAQDKKMWYSVRGVPVWMAKKGLGDKDRPVTRLGMDSEDPLSYGRHAYMMWTLAAVFGKTPVDTSLLNIADMIKVSGKGTMTTYENGNEEDAWWVGNKFCTPMEYFAQSSADYDGHMHKLGNRHGIANADSNSKLIMSGTVGLDTNRVRVLDFLCRTQRPDKKFLWEGGIQYHHYSNTVSASMMPLRWRGPTHGITPEEDSLRKRLAKVRDYTYRLQPNVECILGEYGFDKNQQSGQSTPIVPGYSAAQSQGIMLVRSINAVAFSGFDKLILYWMKDQEPETSPYIYLTSGLVYQSLDGTVKPYPAWFHVNTFMHHLADYVPESIVSEKGNVWIYRYRHQTQKDSFALLVYAPTRKGNKYPGYTVELGDAREQATQISFADNSKTGIVANKSVANGKLVMDVDEVPKIILFSAK